MRKSPALFAALAGLAAGGPAPAQSTASSVYSAAVPPSREALERLHLRTEWAATVPLAGRIDAIASIQAADANQVFVQTRAGLLLALDGVTGAKQWSYRHTRGGANVYPVGLTARHVFAVNVTTLVCLQRFTGLVEFAFDLPGAATAGPVADEENVYVVLGATQLAAFRYPGAIQAPPRAPAPDKDPNQVAPDQSRTPDPAVEAATRYGTRSSRPPEVESDFEAPRVGPQGLDPGSGLSTLQATPSLSSLPRISPPYTVYRQTTTPSLTVVPSLKQPYQFKPEYRRYNQQTPSIAVLRPSIYRLSELSSLLPPAVNPVLLWTLPTSRRIAGEPIQTHPVLPKTASADRPPPPSEVWFTADGPLAYGVNKYTRAVQVSVRTSAPISAPMAGPVAWGAESLLGFIAQDDGTVLALDLTGGFPDNPKVEWRANVGGRLNRKPVPTRLGGVYVGGDNVGLVRLDVGTGEVTWRTEGGADRLLAVNDEFAYVWTHRGELRVYDRKKPTDPATLRADPLGRIELPGFSLPVTNEHTDRVLLGSDNGLLLCLRDAAPKYARPLTVAPLPRQPAETPKPDPAKPDDAKKDEAK